MSHIKEFSFGDSSVANNYDKVLVPVLFKTWADSLIERQKPWTGRRVLDLATGTGIVAQNLCPQVGPEGSVFALDLNPQMLNLAARRCEGLTPAVEFIESSAQALDVPDKAVDFVLCQQGFQFFPDKEMAANEIYRVLVGGGRVVLTTWCEVKRCQFFGAVDQALEEIGERELAEKMRVPFDAFDGSKLAPLFESAGFDNVNCTLEEQELVIDGSEAEAVELIYATPIGPDLRELADSRQRDFQQAFTTLLRNLSPDGRRMGRMVSNLLTADKPTR